MWIGETAAHGCEENLLRPSEWQLLEFKGDVLCTAVLLVIIVQWDATQSSLFIILQVHCTRLGCHPHPSSAVHKTVTTASGTGHIFCAATCIQRGQAWPCWREVAAVPEVAVTVLCIPDDGCGWHPKHVEWIYLNINQLDALNFIMSLFHASTCFEHMCSSSGGQNCTIQHLISSHL